MNEMMKNEKLLEKAAAAVGKVEHIVGMNSQKKQAFREVDLAFANGFGNPKITISESMLPRTVDVGDGCCCGSEGIVWEDEEVP